MLLPSALWASEADVKRLQDFLKSFQVDINQGKNLFTQGYFHRRVSMTFHHGISTTTIPEAKQFFIRLTQSGSSSLTSYQVDISMPQSYQQFGHIWLLKGKAKESFAFSDGLVFELETAWSSELVAIGSSFKVIGLHLSANLFDNPMLKSTGELQSMIGMIGFALGLVVAWLLFRMIRKQMNLEM